MGWALGTFWVAVSLGAVACFDPGHTRPPEADRTNILAYRQRDRPKSERAIVLSEGRTHYPAVGPATDVIWLGYEASPEALDLRVGEVSDERRLAIGASDALATEARAFELGRVASEWAPLVEIPEWVLALEVPRLSAAPVCPKVFGPANAIDPGGSPSALARLQGRIVVSLTATRALALIDEADLQSADPEIQRLSLGVGAAITAMFATPDALILGDHGGQLWRLWLDPGPQLERLGDGNINRCRIGAIDGAPDGGEVLAATGCGDIVRWTPTLGLSLEATTFSSTSAIYDITTMEIAWAAPGEAVVLLDRLDVSDARQILRTGEGARIERLALDDLPDSVTRLDRGVRIAAHPPGLFGGKRWIYCPTEGCGHREPSAGTGSWETEVSLPLTFDHATKIIGYPSGLIYGTSTGQLGLSFGESLPCEPLRQIGPGVTVTGMVQVPGGVVHHFFRRPLLIYTPIQDAPP